MRKDITFLCFLVVLVTLGITVLFTLSKPAEYPVYEFDEGWDVSLNTKYLGRYSNDSIFLEGDLLNTGDVVTISAVLPKLDDEAVPAIQLTSMYCAYDIYLDDDLIIRKNGNEIDSSLNDSENDIGDMDAWQFDGRYIGIDHRIISLPYDSAGKRLKIVLRVCKDNLDTPITDLLYGAGKDLDVIFVHKRAVPLTVGAFLIIFGMIFFIIAIVMNIWMPFARSYLWTSVLCALIGVMLHSRYYISYLYMDATYMSIMFYICIFLIGPLLLLSSMEICRPVKGRIPYYILTGLTVLVAIVAVVLHFTGVAYLYTISPISYATSSIAIIVVMIKSILDFKGGRLDETAKMNTIGLVVNNTFVMISMVFAVPYYGGLIPHNQFTEMIINNIYAIGPVLFSFFQLANFFINASDTYANAKENSGLIKMAYEDGLTGIANRAKVDDYMNKLENDEVDYCYISLDLNGLKAVNDKYGHATGDIMLKYFSGTLMTVFEDIGLCGRMGGDEFIVIIPESTEVEVMQRIARLHDRLMDFNTTSLNAWQIMSAAGYAFRHETEGAGSERIHQTYLLADKRMYDNKTYQYANGQ